MSASSTQSAGVGLWNRECAALVLSGNRSLECTPSVRLPGTIWYDCRFSAWYGFCVGAQMCTAVAGFRHGRVRMFFVPHLHVHFHIGGRSPEEVLEALRQAMHRCVSH